MAAWELLIPISMKRAAIIAVMLVTATFASADVRVASTSDASRCTHSERAHNTKTLRRTIDQTISSKLSTANARIDATLESLAFESRRTAVIVSASVRLAISDEDGRILSVIVGRAKVEQSAGSYRAARDLRSLRDEAIEAAVATSFDKVKVTVASTASRVSPVRVATGAR